MQLFKHEIKKLIYNMKLNLIRATCDIYFYKNDQKIKITLFQISKENSRSTTGTAVQV